MKKLLALVIAVLLTAAMFAGCGPANNEPSQEPTDKPTDVASTEPTEAPPAETEEATGYEIAMITDKGNIDDKSFNQGTWEGIEKYAKENNKTYKYYKPTEVTTDSYVAAIDLAVQGGAKIIVTPGFLFEPAIFVAQDTYPDINFVLIDGTPHNEDYSEFRIEKNVYSIFFAEQQAGFLAGYASVKDGYKKLGFMGGMAVPAVVRFGYGFVQGADVAAKELGLKAGDVEVMYNYTGGFEATPEVQTLAASWYSSGTEVIFGCGGKVGNSVFSAAEAAGGKAIGVDVDQSFESETVITSAMKGVGNAAYSALSDYYGGSFKGGVSEYLDIQVDMVGLPFANSKFNTFSEADYKAICDKLINNTDGLRDSLFNDTTAESADKLSLEIVKVTVVG